MFGMPSVTVVPSAVLGSLHSKPLLQPYSRFDHNVTFAIAEKCIFEQGDGIGTAEKYIVATPTAAACADAVRRSVYYPAVTGVSWGAESNNCFAKFGMTGIKPHAKWQTCWLRGELFPDRGASSTAVDPQFGTKQLRTKPKLKLLFRARLQTTEYKRARSVSRGGVRTHGHPSFLYH